MTGASTHLLIRMLRGAKSLPPCLLAMTLLVAACDAREPLYVGDPEGVNRNGQPQVIIKQDELRLNGFPIKQYRTRATDLIPIIGTDISSQASSDAYWNAMGLQIHAAPDDGALPGSPELIHRVVVWVRPGIDYGKHRDCDASALARHRDSVQFRLETMDQVEKEHGFPRNEAARKELIHERCSMAGNTPENAFSGYFEVDGIPIGPNMSLKEIQSRRKQLGLELLYMDSGPQIYAAPKGKTGPETNQTWIFEVTSGDGGAIVDQRLKAISIP
ncbi:hypothetical protein DEH84_00700 [Aquabacterium olei]|uniref:Uncharacterized protein n=1 Tax=Aquabacterium olei TaxID=1296669 RepID=A0A2U8FME2_9BURK|nr:hypothetical protein [Aquabacterium olei]AWI52130.1 hypothetical protein DEH84_00700 [Aquabacterium olei]